MKRTLLWLTPALGLTLASLSGLTLVSDWIASICLGGDAGCREAAQFRLLEAPVWLWGVAFYALILLLAWRLPRALLSVVAVGFGVEVFLGWIMVSGKLFCIFCILNLALMGLLAALAFDRTRAWQALALTLAGLIFGSLALVPDQPRTVHATHAPSQEIAATVAGQTITSEELNRPIASRIHDLQFQIHQLQRDRLEQLITKVIIEKEAERNGKTPSEFLKDLVAQQTASVDDQEVQNYYLENRNRWTDWKGTEQDLLAQIRAFLQQQKTQQRIMDYARSLQPKYGVVVHLQEPQPPHIQVTVNPDDPALGPENAPVTIVEFSDYECPACRRAHETVRQLRELYQGKVRWVFKDFPMPGHKHARSAAVAAHCAAEQGKFWQYQDLLFSTKEGLSPERFPQFAAELQLDPKRFTQCLEGQAAQQKVDRSIAEGRGFGLNTTPTFIINNRLVSGSPPLERFKEMIDSELQGRTPSGPR